MRRLGKGTDFTDRKIQLRTFPGNGEPIEETIAVSELLMRDSLFRPSDWTTDGLPRLEEINRFLLSGSGDDGHFVHRWQPLEISSEEYRTIAKVLRETQDRQR
jgi:hypothetical protein